MKNKLILLALACGLSASAYAQTQEEETYKPVSGNKALEVGLNFTGGTFGQLKLRSFSSESLAFRYGTSLYFDRNNLGNDSHSTNWIFNFAPGVEQHFAGTKRLSPYIGFTVPLAVSTKRYKSETVEVKGATSETDMYNRSYVSVGLHGVAGVDFYVVQNFYVGFEVGVGADYFKYSNVEVTYKRDFIRNSTLPGYNGFNLSTFTSGGLRVGFAF